MEGLLPVPSFEITESDTIDSPLIIGLTGPLGSGVTTVSQVLEELGFQRWNAGSVSRFKSVFDDETAASLTGSSAIDLNTSKSWSSASMALIRQPNEHQVALYGTCLVRQYAAQQRLDHTRAKFQAIDDVMSVFTLTQFVDNLK